MDGRFWGKTLVIQCVVVGLIVGLLAPVGVHAQDEPIQVLFMHHSTGLGVIEQGGVRERFTALGYEFWDHGYNDEGVVDPAGNHLGINWDVPGDNTDPDGWYHIFNQPVTDPPTNVFSHMLQADVIIFKSCFPTSNIYDEAMFETYRDYYLSIRDVIDQHPDKLFIPFTPPPLVSNETTLENAARAQRWATYLASEEYWGGHPNIAVFDFFHLLADEDGFLRAEYRGDEWDSHPNEVANQAIGPVLVEFVDQAVRDFEPDASSMGPTTPLTTDADQADNVPAEPATFEYGFDAAQVLNGFEDPDFHEWWWTYQDDGVVSFACELDSAAHTGAYALHVQVDSPAGNGAGCGVDFAPDPAWAEAQGVSFYWRADAADLGLRFALLVVDPAQPGVDAIPFEIELADPTTEWTQVTINWADLTRVEWVGDEGAQVFDPAYVVGVIFDLGNWERAQAGSIWLDDLALVP